MIEIELTLSCDLCMEEVTMDETELQEVANFSLSFVGCWGLPPENLPNGFQYTEEDEILCEECAEEQGE